MPQALQGTFHSYKTISRLGQGAFGEVTLARVVETGAVVALKRIPVRSTDGLPDNVAREMKSLQAVDHPNVVALLDVFAKGQAIYLVQEYCVADLGTLLKRTTQPLPEAVAKAILQQMLRGVRACHTAGIMHRDFKPSNVLVSHTGVVKVADMGLARPHNKAERPAYTHTVATRWYRAPELLYGARSYHTAVDLWAVGVTFAELLGLSPLLPGENDIDQLGRVIAAFGSVEDAWGGVRELPDWGKVSFPPCPPKPLAQLLPGQAEGALALLEKLLRYDPDQRLSAEAALMDPYLTQQLPLPAHEDEVAQWVRCVLEPLPFPDALG